MKDLVFWGWMVGALGDVEGLGDLYKINHAYSWVRQICDWGREIVGIQFKKSN